MLISPIADSKKLKIFKCIQANGIVAFQEEVCDSKKTIKHKKQQKPKLKVFNSNSPVKVSIPQNYQAIKIRQNSTNKTLKVTNKVRGYLFSINVLHHWSITNTAFNQKLLHMRFVDSSRNAKISVLIDFIFPDSKKFSIKELYEILYLSASRYVEGSSQGQIKPYELTVKKGKGVVAIFTNSDSVVGYRHLTKGLIYKGDWLIQFTIKSNSLTNNNYIFAMHALTDSIEISH